MEVLDWVRRQPALARLPAAILSSSNQQKDIDTARSLGADDYFVKPGNVVQLAELVQTFRDRWLGPHPSR
jgi:CheY-like chemotaxis protein